MLTRTRPLTPLLLMLAACASLSAGGVSLAASASSSAAGHTASSAHCPIGAGSPSGGSVQWAFTDSAAPTGSHANIATSYTHGRGNWSNGHATGTACHEDSLLGGRASHELVLKIAGAARLSPGITRMGLRGVALELKGTVSASNDPECATGTHGTVTLFASYYSVHRDSLQLRFTGGCADHDHTFTGPQLHVLLTRNGAQVN